MCCEKLFRGVRWLSIDVKNGWIVGFNINFNLIDNCASVSVLYYLPAYS